MYEYGYTPIGGQEVVLGECAQLEEPVKRREIETAEFIEWNMRNSYGRISSSCHWWIREKVYR